jgi:hypothetical protein
VEDGVPERIRTSDLLLRRHKTTLRTLWVPGKRLVFL